jgi:hypothetical protein
MQYQVWSWKLIQMHGKASKVTLLVESNEVSTYEYFYKCATKALCQFTSKLSSCVLDF